MSKKLRQYKPGQVISCKWADAYSVDEWTDPNESELSAPCLIQSVGILVEITDDSVVLALNKNLETESVSCIMHIPKSMVREIKLLK